MKTLPRTGLIAVLVWAPMTLSPTETRAQDPGIAPCMVDAGSTELLMELPAQRIVVSTSKAIGEITRFEPDAESGVKLADPEDVPRIDMASDGDRPRPIQMPDKKENLVVLWLNTEEAVPGTYVFMLHSGTGSCTGHLEVKSGL